MVLVAGSHLAILALLACIALSFQGAVDRFDHLYPHYHVRPSANWVNDPNGPFYDPFHGKYHLFFQHNPNGAEWGDMSWGHAISDDLISWEILPVILTNDQYYDKGGVFSGSVELDMEGNPVLLYTCVDKYWNQLQCLATPVDRTDPELREWEKSYMNPIIGQPPRGVMAQEFRDPACWKDHSISDEDEARDRFPILPL